MNIKLFYIVAIIIVLGIISLLIWIFVEKNRAKSDPKDKSQVINYMPKFSNGHNKGSHNRTIENGDWVAVEFFPRDIDYIKMLEEKGNVAIAPEVVFVPKNCVKILPRGAWSNHVNDIEIYPIKIEDIPLAFDEDQKEYFKKVIERNGQARNGNEIFESWKKHNTEILKKTAGLEIVKDYFNLDEELRKMIIKQVKGEEKKTFNPSQ